MTSTAQKLCILAAWAATSAILCSFATPAMAQEGGAQIQVVMRILDSADSQVHADMMELQELQIALPIGAKTYYSAAVSERLLAEENLKVGSIESANSHAMQAMKLYRTVSDLLADVPELENSEVIEDGIKDHIAVAEKRINYLQTIAGTNNVSMGFSNYQLVINAARQAIANGDIDEASEKVALAESMITDIQNKIQESADAKKTERAEKFVEKMIKRLSKIVSEQEKVNQHGDRNSLIDELNNVANRLRITTNLDEIMTATDDTSRLQSIFQDYKAFLVDADGLNAKGDDDDRTKEEDNQEKSGRDDEDHSGEGGDSSGSGIDEQDEDNSGSNNDENDEEDALKKLADELEERAKDLLDRSNNPVADLKINEALDLIKTAEDRLSDDDYPAASTALSSAETLLDLAEDLI